MWNESAVGWIPEKTRGLGMPGSLASPAGWLGPLVTCGQGRRQHRVLTGELAPGRRRPGQPGLGLDPAARVLPPAVQPAVPDLEADQQAVRPAGYVRVGPVRAGGPLRAGHPLERGELGVHAAR